MSQIPTRKQVSAGGVAFRREAGQIEIALISVGEKARWQLPKGRVSDGEANEKAALREVREEAGVEADLIGLIDEIDYWFYASYGKQRTRIYKQVTFYLMRYRSGSPADHDYEVNEARWVEIDRAYEQLAFESEKGVVQKAKAMILGLGEDEAG